MERYESTGRLRYAYSSNYLVVDCDTGICEYYAHLYYIACHKTRKLQLPAHGGHITVIAGKYESATNHPKWNAYSGEVIKFAYSPIVYHQHPYLGIAIHCPRLADIREELGLSRHPFTPFHLTIGNLKHDTSLQAMDN